MLEEDRLLREAIRLQNVHVTSGVNKFIMDMSAVDMYVEAGVFAVRPSVENVNLGMDRSVRQILKEHRSLSYRPTLGAWFSLQIAVDRGGPVDVQLNYDNEPRWDRGIRDNYYADDFLRFPRDVAHTPPWLVEKLKKFEKELVEKGAQLPW